MTCTLCVQNDQTHLLSPRGQCPQEYLGEMRRHWQNWEKERGPRGAVQAFHELRRTAARAARRGQPDAQRYVTLLNRIYEERVVYRGK